MDGHGTAGAVLPALACSGAAHLTRPATARVRLRTSRCVLRTPHSLTSTTSTPTSSSCLPSCAQNVVAFAGGEADRQLIAQHEFYFPTASGQPGRSGPPRFDVLLVSYDMLRKASGWRLAGAL